MLMDRIALSKKEHLIADDNAHFRPEDSRLSSVSLTKTHEFDLQKVSPIIKNKFPLQLSTNFNPHRVQKVTRLSIEPDLERPESYQIMQY